MPVILSHIHYQTGRSRSLRVTSCAGGHHNMPRPLQVDLWPFDLESGVRVTCDVDYLCANFSLPRPLCSRLKPDVLDRQTDVRRASSLNASALWRRGHNNIYIFHHSDPKLCNGSTLLQPGRIDICATSVITMIFLNRLAT